LIEINHKAFRRPCPACRPSIIHHASVKTDASGTKVSFARAPSNPQTGRSHHLLVSSDHVSARRKHASPESIIAANCRLGMAKISNQRRIKPLLLLFSGAARAFVAGSVMVRQGQTACLAVTSQAHW